MSEDAGRTGFIDAALAYERLEADLKASRTLWQIWSDVGPEFGRVLAQPPSQTAS